MLTWQDVPGYFNFENIYARMVEEAPASGDHFVEIGVLFGQSALFMAEVIKASGKDITFDAVDKMTDESRPGWRQEFIRLASTLPSEVARMAAREANDSATCLADISKWYAREMGLDKYVTFYAEAGQSRASSYVDDSLGFVFIDSDHSYRDTKELIRAYLPLVRVGGVLAGHDYNPGEWPEVIKGVNELLWNRFKIIGDSWISRKQGQVKKTYIPW